MLAIECDELPAYSLKLWERHGGCGELNQLLNVLDSDFTSTLASMIFLVGHDLGEDVGRGLVELVEVVLLSCWFLPTVNMVTGSR